MKKKICTGLVLTAGVVAMLLLVALFRTVFVPSRAVSSLAHISPAAEKALQRVDRERAATHLASVLSIPTISSYKKEEFDRGAFKKLRDTLDTTYPHARKVLQKEIVNDMTVLYTWKGTDPDKKPILLMAHQDVVPVEPGTEADWTFPAFGRTVKDGYVCGRGAVDIKNSLVAVMECVDALAASGFMPEATVYLALGHDEEVGGLAGNKAVAELLEKRGVTLSVVLDEGGAVVKNVIPGVDKPTALVGITEKGYVTVRLTVNGTGGHSSQPPAHTAAGKLAMAVAALEANQLPAKLDGPAMETFDYLAPEMNFGYRFLFRNRWLFGSLLKKVFLSAPSTAAMLRTTTAVTVLKSGEKDNVLPQKAEALINFRILPGETVEDVLAHVRNVVGEDFGVEVYTVSFNPSNVGNADAEEFGRFRQIIATVFPDAVSAPYLVLGGTDSRYYDRLADNVYRFVPSVFTLDDLALMHNTDERVSIENLERHIQFLVRFVDVFAGGSK